MSFMFGHVLVHAKLQLDATATIITSDHQYDDLLLAKMEYIASVKHTYCKNKCHFSRLFDGKKMPLMKKNLHVNILRRIDLRGQEHYPPDSNIKIFLKYTF